MFAIMVLGLLATAFAFGQKLDNYISWIILVSTCVVVCTAFEYDIQVRGVIL